MRGTELAGDQGGVREDSGAECEVDAALDKIELIVGQVQFDLGLRIAPRGNRNISVRIRK